MRSFTVFISALMAAGLAHAQSGFVSLPFAPDSISADGKTVVGEDVLTDSLWMWTAGTGRVNIGGLSTLNAGSGSGIVNGDGTRVIGGAINPTTGKRTPSYYDVASGSWTNLPGLGSATSGTYGSVGTSWAASSDGNFIGGYTYVGGSAQTNVRATIWNVSTGTITNLGDSGQAGPNALTRVNGISDDGRVAGGRGGSNSPMLWTDLDGDGSYTASNISTVTGLTVNQVMAVSANGVWAGGNGATNTQGGAAYIYNVNTHQIQFLGKVNASGRSETVTGMSADGSVVVGYQDNGNATPQERTGFIWRAGIGIQSFDSFLAGYGIDTGNTLNFATPTDVSADGLAFTGFGYPTGSSTGQGWYVNLAAAVPEPSSYAMLLAGLGAVGFIARRRQRAAA